MNLRWSASGVLVVVAANLAAAQGVIHRLPPEGTWSRYRVSQQILDVSVLRVPNAVPKEARDGLIDALPKAGAAEGTLTIAHVGTEAQGEDRLHWIEIVWAVGAAKRSYRLLVPADSLRPGGDVFQEAVRFLVKKPDFISKAPNTAEGPVEEIADAAGRASESLLVRHLFPTFPAKCEQRDVPLELVPDQDPGAPPRGDTYRFRYKFSGQPPGGGDLASHRHEGQYFGIVSNRAPFGGHQLVMTDGMMVESGDCLTEARDDVLVTMTKSSLQIALIESGTGAKSHFGEPKKQPPRTTLSPAESQSNR